MKDVLKCEFSHANKKELYVDNSDKKCVLLPKSLNFSITELNRINSTDEEEMSNVIVFMFIFWWGRWAEICKKALESTGEEIIILDELVY